MKDSIEKINDLSRLCVKIGTFFSNCDGNFDKSERDFLNMYVQSVRKNLNSTFDPNIYIEEEIKAHLSIENIITATNDFLAGFDENEKAAIKGTLSVLIDKIINVDGKNHPNETKFFEQWKKEVL